MGQVEMEKLLDQCGSLYKLVLLAAKRAKEVADGNRPLVETSERKATSVALEEIGAGKIAFKDDEPEETGKKRSRKSKKG